MSWPAEACVDFMELGASAAHLAPISLIILLAFIGLAWFLFKEDLRTGRVYAVDLEALDTAALITDHLLLRKALIVMTGVILGFLIHGAMHLEPATIALTGATVLMRMLTGDLGSDEPSRCRPALPLVRPFIRALRALSS